MHTPTSIASATLFVLLAGFNVWSMLSSHTRSKLSNRAWTQLHRAAGYGFIALLAIFLYFMLLRVKGWPHELTPRIILHMALALSLPPLLFVKVIVARSQNASHGLLCGLGIGIFAIAFTLVALNIAAHFLRSASSDTAPAWMSGIFLFAVLLSAGLAFASRFKRHEDQSNGTFVSESECSDNT